MKKLVFLLLFFATLTLFAPSVKAQQTEGGCTQVGQCVGNKRCVVKPVPGAPSGTTVITPQGGACGSSQIGGITPPGAVQNINGNLGGQIGIIVFLSKLINLFVIICGIWTLFNFLYSGYVLITSMGDVKAQSEVKDRVTMTAIGLAIIAGAYIIAGLIGLIFFGDATFILNPKLTSALGS